MATLNVNRNVTDAFYRYKMPRIIAKVEGKGNGIKTVVVNMADVAKALGRPATYPTKYFGCELGAQTKFDFKNDRYIVNGAHESDKLQTLLDGFIHKFVLCSECDNPETILNIQPKKGIITANCRACGHQSFLDMRHKLTTFILKNPPDVNPAAQGASLTKRKEKRRETKTNGEGMRSGSPNGSDMETTVTEEAEDDDWAVDVSAEAVKARMQDLTHGAKGLTVNDDLEKTEKARIDLFYEFVRTRRDCGQLAGADKEILAEAERLDVRDKGPLVLSELLFTENMLAQVRTHRILMLRFTHDNKKSQKYLLGGVEQTINLYRDTLLPKSPHVLKLLYDLDILEEDVILEWGKKASKKYVPKEVSTDIRAQAKPFLQWLQDAEEESEGDDDDEEDVEIEYDDRARTTQLQAKCSPSPAPPKNAQDTAEDLDIDAI